MTVNDLALGRRVGHVIQTCHGMSATRVEGSIPSRTTMELIVWPNVLLTRRCLPVLVMQNVTPAVTEMVRLMTLHNGCGFAANQMGWHRRVFVVREHRDADLRVFINPQISEGQGEVINVEGCLSLPGNHFRVPRFEKIRIKATGLNGERIDEAASGNLARIYQHENDHLDGLLINRFEEVRNG